jgi:hypothetical protein
MKFLIDFKADALDADISAYLQQHGCTVLKEWDKFDKIFLVEADSMPPDADITDRITEENHLAIKPLDVNLTTLMIDYLDFAIQAEDGNTPLQDKVLDTIIISVK